MGSLLTTFLQQISSSFSFYLAYHSLQFPSLAYCEYSSCFYDCLYNGGSLKLLVSYSYGFIQYFDGVYLLYLLLSNLGVLFWQIFQVFPLRICTDPNIFSQTSSIFLSSQSFNYCLLFQRSTTKESNLLLSLLFSYKSSVFNLYSYLLVFILWRNSLFGDSGTLLLKLNEDGQSWICQFCCFLILSMGFLSKTPGYLMIFWQETGLCEDSSYLSICGYSVCIRSYLRLQRAYYYFILRVFSFFCLICQNNSRRYCSCFSLFSLLTSDTSCWLLEKQGE